MTVTVIDADDESHSTALSEQDEDMADYYNQPETLLEEPAAGDRLASSGSQSVEAGYQSVAGNQPAGDGIQPTAVVAIGAMEEATANLLSAIESSMATLQNASEQLTVEPKGPEGSDGKTADP